MNTIGEHIKKKRISLKLNKAEMSSKLGISGQLLGQYEMNKHNPKTMFVAKWKEMFDEDLFEMFLSKESRFDNMVTDYNATYNNSKKENNKDEMHEIKTSLRDILEFQKALMVNIDTYLEPLLNDLGKRNGEENLPSKLRSSAALKLQKVLEMDI